MISPRVHDVIRIGPHAAQRWTGAPTWVTASLRRASWVVVRRAGLGSGYPAGAVPVGVRGACRAQRFPGWIVAGDIREVCSPATLVPRIPAESADPGTGRLAAAARAVGAAAGALGIEWGPVGAYGFELASGVSTTHADSDLDIVLAVKSGTPLSEFARRCAHIGAATGVRCDVEVALDGMSFALDELVGGRPAVLAKTPGGPRLVANPLAVGGAMP